MAKNNAANEKIVGEFQKLRNEQRNLVTNISQLEMDLKEHKLVENCLVIFYFRMTTSCTNCFFCQ